MSLLWLKFKGYVIAAGAGLALLVTIFLKGKAAGREQAELKQREAADAARKRKEGVQPATSGSTVDKLQSGKF